ncbi:MAG: hypothetical protein LUD72_02170 [Bacteroidales bacterium]|nr:hypothetical protein [Bacteroidales bacterium]
METIITAIAGVLIIATYIAGGCAIIVAVLYVLWWMFKIIRFCFRLIGAILCGVWYVILSIFSQKEKLAFKEKMRKRADARKARIEAREKRKREAKLNSLNPYAVSESKECCSSSQSDDDFWLILSAYYLMSHHKS